MSSSSFAKATCLCYFRNSSELTACCKVLAVAQAGDSSQNVVLHFDKTPFYPGGGGQPCDKGKAIGENCEICVEKVGRNAEIPAVIDHLGKVVSGVVPTIGQELVLQVDSATRTFYNRLHSAGHVIDAALSILKISFAKKPLKAFHYPESPYVQFNEPYYGCKETLISLLQEQCDRLIEQDLPVFIDFANDDPLDQECERKMRIAGIISIPCGGTHVSSLGAIGKVIIRRIELKKGTTKVCYQIK
jgi:alanyl-tRNA synthetase